MLSFDSLENYIFTRKLNLNKEQVLRSSHLMYQLVTNNFKENMNIGYRGKSTPSTKVFNQYNLLMYPFPGFYELYIGIRDSFRHFVPEGQHYIQCWLNYYQKGDFIDWHGHWVKESNSWHGIYCVDVEESKTTYKIPGIEHLVDVVGQDDLLILSKSDGDKHRSSEWLNDRPRITIAFDVVPAVMLNPRMWLNHWVPI